MEIQIPIRELCYVIKLQKIELLIWGGGALRSNAGHGLLIHEISRSHSDTPHSR